MKNFKPIIPQGFIRMCILSFGLFSMIFFASYTQKEVTVGVEIAELPGQALYKSIFFSDGKLAQEIKSYDSNVETISNFTTDQKEEYRQNIEKLMDYIDEQSPDFFDNFKSAILSKDHRKIKEAILDGNIQMHEFLKNLYPNINKVYEKMGKDIGSGKILTDGELDQSKVESQLENYNELLTDNAMASSEGIVLPSYHCHLSIVVVCIIKARYLIVHVEEFIPMDKRELFENEENLLAFEMLINEIASVDL